MGQSNSINLQQSQISVPKINQLTQLRQGYDIRYGEIKVYKVSDYHAIAVKDHVFEDDESWNKFKINSEKLIIDKQRGAFLISIIDLQHVTEKELCTQLTQAHSIYEFYDEYLERTINELFQSKVNFDEIEIVAMIHCILSALIKLNENQKTHGDIRPLTISLTSYAKKSSFRQNEQFTVFKLTDIQELTGMNAYKRCIAKEKGQFNLSPEQLTLLKSNILQPNYDINKSDVFCIGLTALQMATLNTLQDIYDFKTHTLLVDKLDNHIFKMKTLYSDSFCQIVCELLTLSPENRLNPQAAHDLLSNFRFQLEDYFRNSTIQYLIPNYQIEFKSTSKQIGTNQTQSKMINNDIHDLYQQFENLEQRAKIALKRSQDAQLRSQQSPSGRFNQPNLVTTTNLQEYNNLIPITMQEIQQLQIKQEIPSNRQSFFVKNLANVHEQQPQFYNDYSNVQLHHNEDEYVYNQQEIDEQPPKQSLVEQVELTNSNLKQFQKNSTFGQGTFQQQQLFQSINTDQGKQQYQQQIYSQSNVQSKNLQNADQQSQPRSSIYNNNNYPSNQINESVAERSPYAQKTRQSLAMNQDVPIAQQLTGQQVEQTLTNYQNLQQTRQESFGIQSSKPIYPVVTPRTPEENQQQIIQTQQPQSQLFVQQERSPLQQIQDQDSEHDHRHQYNPQLTGSDIDSQQNTPIQSKPESLRGTVTGSQMKVPPSAASRTSKPVITKQTSNKFITSTTNSRTFKK